MTSEIDIFDDCSYKLFDDVEIVGTTDSRLDGQQGYIIGVSAKYPGAYFYIVRLLNEPICGTAAIVLIEHCLKRVE